MHENISFDVDKIRRSVVLGWRNRWIVLVIICLIIVFTSWFTIDPEEVGVVLRFGKFNRTVNPGLHFKMPFSIETVFKVPVERQLKEEFGFRTLQAGVSTRYSKEIFRMNR